MAIADSVLIEHGATIMPVVWKEPLAIDAPTSRRGWTWSANASSSAGVRSVSIAIVVLAGPVTKRWISAPTSRSISTARIP